MKLKEGKKGQTYTVKTINAEESLERRLRMLGLTDGSFISILGKKRCGSMVVKIRGTRFALGSAVSSAIEVGGETECRKQ